MKNHPNIIRISLREMGGEKKKLRKEKELKDFFIINFFLGGGGGRGLWTSSLPVYNLVKDQQMR